ncbi:MAG: histidine kinase [Flavobacterium sp.]|jgi:hypothetical protein|nr:histidine kinase [Flavobacterium sp.]
MAIHYNLAKVYANENINQEFTKKILNDFINHIPEDLKKIEFGIESKQYDAVKVLASKIKPTFDTFGMHTTFEELELIEHWTEIKGKRKEVAENFKNIQSKVNKAIKEIKKDFNL